MKLPEKGLGQHWLTDEAALQDIVEFADIKESDTVVEVGPGPGGLTYYLSQAADKVIAIEYDKYWADQLRGSYKNVEVVEADIREVNFSEFGEYKVVANIPYYLTNYLIKLMTDAENPPQSFTILVQKEVAERMAADPGEMSLLSLATQLYGDVSLGVVVPNISFDPPPKVDSRVIKAVKHQREYDKQEIMRLAKAGFSNKRKKLLNSLSGGLRISKDEAAKLLSAANIDENARAQELSLKQWQKLSEAYRAAE